MADFEDIVDRNAAWGARFPNATNLAIRARRAADAAAYEDQQALRDQAAFEKSLTKDPGVRALYLGRERIRQGDERLRQGRLDAGQRQANFETAQERLLNRDEVADEMRTRDMELKTLNNERLMRKDLRDTDNARRVLTQTMQAEDDVQALLDDGVRPGSQAFAQGALKAVLSNPYLDPKARASILGGAKIISGENENLDDVLDMLDDAERKHATVTRATVTRDSKGGWRVSLPPQKTPGANSIDDLRREYDTATAKRAAMEGEGGKLKAGYSEDDRLFYDDMKRSIMGRIRELAPDTSGPASTPSPPSSSFSNADEVRASMRSGKISREEAVKVLREQFQMQ